MQVFSYFVWIIKYYFYVRELKKWHVQIYHLLFNHEVITLIIQRVRELKIIHTILFFGEHQPNYVTIIMKILFLHDDTGIRLKYFTSHTR